MEERRKARVGTVGGLALLTGTTGLAMAAGDAHSVFATTTLGLLAIGMAHALLDETRRQATRGPHGGWVVQDTVNTVLLGSWAGGALLIAILLPGPLRVRTAGAALALGYAAICAYFVWLRRRTLATTPQGYGHSPLSTTEPANRTKSTEGTRLSEGEEQRS
ncbi:MAG TPA: hypothetical protein VFO77_06685 [Actinoplanes sp.]|nr:hypothetical protein [Actinoplanes sp.]